MLEGCISCLQILSPSWEAPTQSLPCPRLTEGGGTWERDDPRAQVAEEIIPYLLVLLCAGHCAELSLI